MTLGLKLTHFSSGVIEPPVCKSKITIEKAKITGTIYNDFHGCRLKTGRHFQILGACNIPTGPVYPYTMSTVPHRRLAQMSH